jgi:hypothetical protein
VIDPTRDQQDLALDPGRPGGLVQAREDDHFHRALEILDRGDRHRGLGLGDHRPDTGHDPAHHHPLLVE